MSELRDDGALRERFRGLREETGAEARTPEFRAMYERAVRDAAERPELLVVSGGRRGGDGSRRLARIGAWGSVALAAGVAALLLLGRGPSGDEDFARLVEAYASHPSIGAWSSPTSALLDVPGMDLTRTLPTIGAPVRGLDPSTLPGAPGTPEGNS